MGTSVRTCMDYIDQSSSELLCFNILFLQGLTGNPGVSGPEGKLGPLVSKFRMNGSLVINLSWH